MTRKERRAAEDRRDEAMFRAHHEKVCRWNKEEREDDEFNAPWSEDIYADHNAWDFMEEE